MTWILGLLLASSAIFNKALVLPHKTQITLASPALHVGLNEMFVKVLRNFQVGSWVSGLGRGLFLFALCSFGFMLLHLHREGGDLCWVGLYPHSEPAECCYRAPWDWLLHECLLKIKECNCEQRDLKILDTQQGMITIFSSFSACLYCVIEHRHACVCVPSSATSFFLTMSSWSCRGVLGLTDRTRQWLWNRIFSPGSHCQWASVFVCLAAFLCTWLAAPRLQLSNESKPSLGGALQGPWD